MQLQFGDLDLSTFNIGNLIIEVKVLVSQFATYSKKSLYALATV